MDKEALTEVNLIIEAMPEEESSKISNSFKKFIKDNMSTTYKPNIDLSIPLEQQELKKDTITMFSLIYRNYFCTKEEKTRLMEQDRIELARIEQEKQEKYNPDNLFKNEKSKNEETISNTNNVNNTSIINNQSSENVLANNSVANETKITNNDEEIVGVNTDNYSNEVNPNIAKEKFKAQQRIVAFQEIPKEPISNIDMIRNVANNSTINQAEAINHDMHPATIKQNPIIKVLLKIKNLFIKNKS